ncbi:MAG: DUF2730 family protein [Rhizobiales bacterium]|nr:DUF2730 family protein [Hyphomicrobiales bacterium]
MPENANQWINAINGLIAVGAFLFAWLTRSGKEAKAQVEVVDQRLSAVAKDLGAKIDAVEDRVSRVEGELSGVPDRESVHKMQLELERMRGTIDVLNERLVPLAAISGRLQEFLLEQAKAR